LPKYLQYYVLSCKLASNIRKLDLTKTSTAGYTSDLYKVTMKRKMLTSTEQIIKKSMHQHAAKWTEQNKSQAIRQQTFDIKTSSIKPIITKPLGFCVTWLLFQSYCTLRRFTWKTGKKNFSRFCTEIIYQPHGFNVAQ